MYACFRLGYIESPRGRRISRALLGLLFCISVLCGAKPHEAFAQVASFPEKKNNHLSIQRVDDRLLLRVPSPLLDRDMLFVRSFRAGEQVHVRWIREGSQLRLMRPRLKTVGNEEVMLNAERGFDLSVDAVIGTFPIVDDDVSLCCTIDATSLFSSSFVGLPETEGQILEGSSFVVDYKNEASGVSVLISETVIGELDSDRHKYTGIKLHLPMTRELIWELIVLPENAMPARRFDPRVGFAMDIDTLDDKYSALPAAITRWWLERSNPSARISDPVSPIVFYIDSDVPSRWRQWVRQGIETWDEAFRAAGISNAIQVEDAPGGENAKFTLSGAKHVYVDWSDISNTRTYQDPRENWHGGGFVRRVVDQRTGEIIRANMYIRWPIDFMLEEYFVRAAPLDPRAKKWPLDDALIGQILMGLVAHETGHVLGLKDGSYGNYYYPLAAMRDSEWVRQNGFTPSIMNFARGNYVVQPEDNMPPELLVLSKIGPADVYSIRWGYTAFEDLEPTEVGARLREIADEQNQRPWLRYFGKGHYLGPSTAGAVAAADDPIAATELGLRNLKRVTAMLFDATVHEKSTPDLTEHMYFRVLEHWELLMGHVVTLVGGFTHYNRPPDDQEDSYVSVPALRQHEALEFLGEFAFQTPAWLIRPELTRRFEESGTVKNITQVQKKVLLMLMSSHRLSRVSEANITSGSDDIYSLNKMLADLRSSIWKELESEEEDRRIVIDPFRQEVQWAYVQQMTRLINAAGRSRSGAYEQAVLAQECERLLRSIDEALRGKNEDATRGHLSRVRAELTRIVGN